ncbi:MAG: hypothetical protein KC486_12070 [Myxococcales bacterium]|nr:hypothetical protein [Myxococcales bacterium]
MLLTAPSEIQRDVADKASTAAKDAASRVADWFRRSPSGPLRSADHGPRGEAAPADEPDAAADEDNADNADA